MKRICPTNNKAPRTIESAPTSLQPPYAQASHRVMTTKNSSSLLHRINPFSDSKIPTNITSELIGKTVSPDVASKTRNIVHYNGVGCIQDIPKPLTAKKYNLILHSLIQPPSQTPTNSTSDLKTPAEALITITSLIKNSDELPYQTKLELLDSLKFNYLAGGVQKQSLKDIQEFIKLKTGFATPVLNHRIENVLSSMAKEFYITRHLDNYYGRLFETELSKNIIHNPTPAMDTAKRIINYTLEQDFRGLSRSLQKTMCKIVADALRSDKAPWIESVNECKSFLASESPVDFIAMLKCDRTYSIPLTLSVAVKYLFRAPAFEELMDDCTELYEDVILPQRTMLRVENSKETSSRHGVMLHYQHDDRATPSGLGNGVRPMDRYQIPTLTVTSHNQEALMSERAIGIGMSGSSNILNFLYLRLEREHPDFHIDDARLMTAAYLTFSGGHSFNEAYTVFGYQNNHSFKPLSFLELYEKNSSAKKSIDNAYNAVLSAAETLQTGN
ncbi:hypothetical protein PS865_04470 [Pseudomonas fluorescens]|uniref:hypothetical protein n=1 Tax=Pseudomonas fluorescens TaxID=294 RepID=UPI00124015D8|nr:hypothetical protein [Pseudomonas fluorescens]VVP33190.1 hypothetical protein PS865_04470 [Pseudomonas fluorescens]